MPGIRRFEDLTCWKEARALSRAIEHWLAKSTNPDESYIDQLRRASLSVQCNIAEGFDRFTHKEFHRFLRIAKASLAEVRALLIVGFDRGILDAETHASLAGQAELLAKRLAHLMRYLRIAKPRCPRTRHVGTRHRTRNPEPGTRNPGTTCDTARPTGRETTA